MRTIDACGDKVVIEFEETDKCILIGMLDKEEYNSLDIGRRVYSQEGTSPTIHTLEGGETWE